MKQQTLFQEVRPPLIAEQRTGNILSLFDYSGTWSKYYRENGYCVMQIDLQLGDDIMTWQYRNFKRNHFAGILAAVPCTDTANCGAKFFEGKDNDGRTYESMALTYKTLAIIHWFMPGLRWWVIENPASRIHILCPDLGTIKCKFDPYRFAGWLDDPLPEQYGKPTWLFGNFRVPVLNEKACLINGMDRHSKVGGRKDPEKEIEAKNYRSKTPLGFAYAFYLANW